MKNYIILVFCIFSIAAKSQSKLDWDKDYELTFADFKAPTTQVGEGNIYSVYTNIGFHFEFMMSNYEFMFTKNFNSKVSNEFDQSLASIISPDSAMAYGLLRWANFEFDLSELYARKIRKKLFESKGAFSNTNFFQPIFNEVQKEYMQERTMAMSKTDIGQKRDEIMELHAETKRQIELLNDFCKTCKPSKKKK